MIDVAPPPLELVKRELLFPRPAIVRLAEPWEMRLSDAMARNRLPPAVRHAVIAELRRHEGARKMVLRPALADLGKWAGLDLTPLLAGTVYVSHSSDPPALVTFIAAPAAQTNNSANYTFASAAIGTAAADRLVVVVCMGGGTATSLSGGSIGGNAAALVVTDANGPACGIIALVVASGTTATIDVNWSGSNNHCSVAVFNVTSWLSSTATNTGASGAAGNATSNSIALTVEDDGVAVIGGTNNVPAAITYGGGASATPDYDASVESASRHSASHVSNVFGALTITTAWSGSGTRKMAGAAFR